jgi:predicted TPR repeat methyltransferase
MGETMFKEAKSADKSSLAAREFTAASSLAPQWPEARHNLGLAKEAAGDYSGAMADLKLCQQFQLSDGDIRRCSFL